MNENVSLKGVEFFKVDHPWIHMNTPVAVYSLKNCRKINNCIVNILDNIEDYYLNNKPNSIQQGKDGQTNTKSILTKNFSNFNVFDHTEYEEIILFKQFVANSYEHFLKNFVPESFFNFEKEKNKIEISCWGNKLRRYDYLDRHVHIGELQDCMPSGNYYVKSPGHRTFTRYYHPLEIFSQQSMNIINEEGDLTLFPVFVYHGTSSNRSYEQCRYTLGMDTIFNKGTVNNLSLVKLFS